jgi:hypothetical protein
LGFWVSKVYLPSGKRASIVKAGKNFLKILPQIFFPRNFDFTVFLLSRFFLNFQQVMVVGYSFNRKIQRFRLRRGIVVFASSWGTVPRSGFESRQGVSNAVV